MKTTSVSRIAITLSLTLLVAAPFAVRADDTQKPSGADHSARHAKMHEWILKKFDTNGNGKIDPDEREAMKKCFEEKRAEGGGKHHGGWHHHKPAAADAAPKQ